MEVVQRHFILNRSLLITTRDIINGGGRLRRNAHLAGIIPVSFKVSPKLFILFNHPVRRQRRSRQQRQSAPNPERSSVPADGGIAPKREGTPKSLRTIQLSPQWQRYRSIGHGRR